MPPPPSSQPSIRDPTGAARADGTYNRDGSPDLDSSVTVDKDEKRWDNRAFDEAQFEAVLEAEKRRTSQA